MNTLDLELAALPELVHTPLAELLGQLTAMTQDQRMDAVRAVAALADQFVRAQLAGHPEAHHFAPTVQLLCQLVELLAEIDAHLCPADAEEGR
ncbi:hypothetical protein [Nocardioides sp. zg-DK7169]|uniref:hypothetical protein n=1 Tax=Nocardioides sp. zg-DK7169 TaxID=2736600 RepID=UPI001555DCFD|nr:hypothetical protein [Nocardioides sp. zg-DK7169]NPC96607.1 hypothetical protein [Nocardioides sp. zg-DK7169]